MALAAKAATPRVAVPAAFRWSALLTLPALGAAIVLAEPVVSVLTTGRAGAGAAFRTDLALLVPWLLATIALWSVLPSLFATKPAGRPLPRVAAIVAAHVGAGLAGRAIAGFDGLVASTCVAPLAYAAFGAARMSLPRRAAAVVGHDAAVALGAAVAAYGAALLVTAVAFDGGWALALAGALAGTIAYGAVARAAFPAEAAALAGAALPPHQARNFLPPPR